MVADDENDQAPSEPGEQRGQVSTTNEAPQPVAVDQEVFAMGQPVTTVQLSSDAEEPINQHHEVEDIERNEPTSEIEDRLFQIKRHDEVRRHERHPEALEDVDRAAEDAENDGIQTANLFLNKFPAVEGEDLAQSNSRPESLSSDEEGPLNIDNLFIDKGKEPAIDPPLNSEEIAYKIESIRTDLTWATELLKDPFDQSGVDHDLLNNAHSLIRDARNKLEQVELIQYGPVVSAALKMSREEEDEHMSGMHGSQTRVRFESTLYVNNDEDEDDAPDHGNAVDENIYDADFDSMENDTDEYSEPSVRASSPKPKNGVNPALDSCNIVKVSDFEYGVRGGSSYGSDIVAIYQESAVPRERTTSDRTQQEVKPTDEEIRDAMLAIKINSPLLLPMLREVTNILISDTVYVAPPYKFFILYWGQLLSKLDQLKGYHEALASDLADPSPQPSSEPIDTPGEDSTQPSTELTAQSSHELDPEAAADASQGHQFNEPANSKSEDLPQASGEIEEGISTIHADAEDFNDAKSVSSVDTLYDVLEGKRMALHQLQQNITHLECLMNFIREQVGPSVEVQERLMNGTLERISFGDLWQLYTVGEVLLYKHDGREQACQVFSISGGRLGTPLREDILEADVLNAYDLVALEADEKPPERENETIPQYPQALVNYAPSAYQGTSVGATQHLRQDQAYTPLVVDCFFMDFNGTYVGPCYLPLTIQSYAGEKQISSLDIYPIRLHKSADSIMDSLRSRGRRLLGCTGHRMYDSLTLSGPDEIQGQVFIDFVTGYRKIGWPSNRNKFGKLSRRDVPIPDSATSMTEVKKANDFDNNLHRTWSEQFIDSMKRDLWRYVKPDEYNISDECYELMSYVALGYAFQMRRWYYFDVDHICDIDKSDAARGNGWEDLVIPSAYRELLVALVESHASGSTKRVSHNKKPSLLTQMDLVRGKGRGLIILLHGPPGSGKTSTAETIAAYTKRPLYSITCGDIGSTAREIERNLEKHFDLANQWGCVLLLDEADVFLTKRNWHDITRNALVSVWLRILEYYSGILFITTNRIGVIDEAFKSRIHICLRYPGLDVGSTRLIWEKLLNRINRDNEEQAVKIIYDRDSLLGFAEKHYHKNAATESTWNGRQIRNAFQTAIALGQYERLRKLKQKGMTEEEAEASGKEKYMRVELTKQNFHKIAATATDFEQYLTSVRGSDVNSARNESVRDDDFNVSSQRARKQYGVQNQRLGEPSSLLGSSSGLNSISDNEDSDISED